MPEMVIDGTVNENVPVLVAGLHRLQAALRLGVNLPYQEIDEADAELWEITENFCRADLTKLERSELLARWADLTLRKINGNLPENPRRGRPGLAAAAARDLRISERSYHRGIEIAGLSPEAKAAAAETKLANTQSALLQAAKAPAEQQEHVIRTIAAEKAHPRQRSAPQYVVKRPEGADLPLEERMTDLQRAFRGALIDLAERHLAAELPTVDVGCAVEILEVVAAMLQAGEISAAPAGGAA
jgi:hypothetical protein